MKIIIIGAGAAGVYCGHLLQQQGYAVTILESRNRVGGRVYSIDGVDLGGSWISSQQPRIYQLCQELGCELIPQFEDGKNVYFTNAIRSVSGNDMTQDFSENKVIADYISMFNDWANKFSLFGKFYQELDKISVKEWLKDNIHDQEALEFFNLFASGSSTTNSSRMSMLFLLYFLKSGRGFECLTGNKNGAQEFRIVGGVQPVFEKLAQNLDVHFDQQVIQVIKADIGKYTVITKDKQEYHADKVICAIPANLISQIDWQPNLEADRLQLYEGMRMGKVTKLVLKYDQPFWRESGYSGGCISDTPPITVCFDGSGTEYYAIIIFVAHIHGEIKEYTNESILNQLAQLLDNDMAKLPSKTYRKDWAYDEFAGGCYFNVPKIGDGHLYHYLTKPHGNIYFIGTETANEWYGYIDGALESAIRVVDQIK